MTKTYKFPFLVSGKGPTISSAIHCKGALLYGGIPYTRTWLTPSTQVTRFTPSFHALIHSRPVKSSLNRRDCSFNTKYALQFSLHEGFQKYHSESLQGILIEDNFVCNYFCTKYHHAFLRYPTAKTIF